MHDKSGIKLQLYEIKRKRIRIIELKGKGGTALTSWMNEIYLTSEKIWWRWWTFDMRAFEREANLWILVQHANVSKSSVFE